ncbi:MAG: GDP-mannose 4,6-dehydratase [Elusimicrobia bacterium]|jgi:GDPmannose 4,6-dehydratase|nr:GDP-mannose 4,6-dehydratase [Elusimicrobiota bacterium]
MKKALITGIRGQDGAYLARFLIDKGYKVYGADRRSGDSSLWRMKELGIEDRVEHIYMDLLEYINIIDVIKNIKPDEVYNLAAQSFVQASFDQPLLTADIDAVGVLRILEAIRYFSPKTKFYQASTSEMFGKVQSIPQNEKTPFYPRSPYAVSKLFAHWMVVNYRESYNIFGCCGILFNHESPLRGLEFITRKTTDNIARIKYGLKEKLVVGNLDSKRDWGYAKEYVEGMWLMLQQKNPDDYVLATGETHTIRELIEYAFNYIGIKIAWKGKGLDEKGIDKKSGKVLVEVSKKYYRPAEVDLLLGDPSKAKKNLGWKPETKFKKLIEIMMEADLKRVGEEIK